MDPTTAPARERIIAATIGIPLFALMLGTTISMMFWPAPLLWLFS